MGVKYPIYRQGKAAKHIVEFTSLTEGTVVEQGKARTVYNMGYHNTTWVRHTDTTIWDPVEDPKTPLILWTSKK